MSVRLEGLSIDELVALPDDEFEGLILTGRPVTFRAGTAEILGQFELVKSRLVVELAHIDGGGEGVLPTLVRSRGGTPRSDIWRRSSGWCLQSTARNRISN